MRDSDQPYPVSSYSKPKRFQFGFGSSSIGLVKSRMLQATIHA